MALPRPDEYHLAVQNPRNAFKDPELQFCKIETDPLGLPVVKSGGFASIYHLYRKEHWAALRWETIIEQKATELGRFLLGGSLQIDFSRPAPLLERTDNGAVRKVILSLAQSVARKRGIGRSTLHYLRTNATRNSSFTLRRKTLRKLRLESAC